ncbi:testis-specific serine/threonine-protein kinase 1-like [Leuresthes tenuis]|uniref:testis-specific serine/threonine-protein kinase 1-like n=1 Tax=Leuresthes tenuis TaxID=355514 RepID=UPI003B50A4F4
MNKTFMESYGYTFKGLLGEGTFGKVVKAHSTHLRKLVAIKIIDTKKVNPSYKEKFLCREKEIVKSLKHLNIVTTHEIFESHMGTVYVVMELCLMGDLSKLIAVKGVLTENLSCRLFKHLCLAVQYLHDMDVAHRDLKCENLLLDNHFNLKVCDFGLSKKLTYIDGQMELSETYCGTSSYAAPEILKNCPYNPKVSDVWSMGVVLYMMLYASAPFGTMNITKMVKIQMGHKINFPRVMSVSTDAKSLIRRMLHPIVEQRIKISDILASSWMLCVGKMEHSDEASTSTPSSAQGRPPDEKAKDNEQESERNSDPEEGPSASGPRQQSQDENQKLVKH